MPESDLHALAVSVGATVLGEPDTRRHYLFSLEELAELVRILRTPELPPCPVSLPLAS